MYLFILIKMLLQGLIHRIVGSFGDQAFKRRLVYLCVIEFFNIVIFCIAEIDNRLFERCRTLLVRVGRGDAVAAVYLGLYIVLIDINVLLDILYRLVVILFSELIRLDQSAFKRVICIRVQAERGGRRDLTAARLIFEGFLLGAVVKTTL